MNLEYWGLSRHPFSNIPDPYFFFADHKSAKDCINTISSSLAEDKDTFSAIIGTSGVGKTMCLRMILDKVDIAKFSIAFVTNPDMTFPQFLAEIIGQFEGKACGEKEPDLLVKRFAALTSSIHKSNKRPLIIIDEGNSLKPHNFENIYMLVEILHNNKANFSIILGSQPETEKRLRDHKGTNLLDTIDNYCTLKGLESRDMLSDYIDYRLAKAGANSDRKIFSPEATAALWSISESGNPRLTNKICILCLKLGASKSLAEIDRQTVSTVGTKFMQSNLKQYKVSSSSMPDIQPLIEHSSEDTTQGEPDVSDDKISYEIRPDAVDVNNIDYTKKRAQKQSTAKVPLSSRELEELASRLATQRIKSRNDLSDTFEAWEEVRNDILLQLKKSKSATTN